MTTRPARPLCTCGNRHATAQEYRICEIRKGRHQAAARRLLATGDFLAQRRAAEADRARRLVAGELNVDTLPSPTWEQFTMFNLDPSDCGEHEGECREEDRGRFPCTWHLYDEDWDKWAWWRGKKWLRNSWQLKEALGLWRRDTYWAAQRAEDNYNRALAG